MSCSSPHSSDQTLLRLPAATETPLSAHCFAPAAGLHAGRAQAQSLHLLAQHRQIDTVQEVKSEERKEEEKLRREREREDPEEEEEKSSLLVPE